MANVLNKFQCYHGKAIRGNVGDAVAMQNVMMEIF